MKISKKKFETISSTLKKIYFEFHSKGVQTIYLWGSVLSEEYSPSKSDVDSIAIVDNKIRPEEENLIRKRIKQLAPKIKDFNINFLYLNELNGRKIRSRLATNIPPRLLLLDFAYWKRIAGRKFLRSDFKMKNVSFDEAIKIRLEKIFGVYFSKGGSSADKYLIKSIMKICHYLNEKEKGNHHFTYLGLMKKSPKERKNIVKRLLSVKNDNWSKESIELSLPEIRRFLNGLSTI